MVTVAAPEPYSNIMHQNMEAMWILNWLLCTFYDTFQQIKLLFVIHKAYLIVYNNKLITKAGNTAVRYSCLNGHLHSWVEHYTTQICLLKSIRLIKVQF